MGWGVVGELLAGPWAPWGLPWGPLRSSGPFHWGPLEALKDGMPVGMGPMMILGGAKRQHVLLNVGIIDGISMVAGSSGGCWYPMQGLWDP